MDEPPSPPFDLDRALAALAGRRSLLIYTHDNPDPDALAAALGLQRLAETELGVVATLTYGGIVGRAQNRAMVENLKMPLTPVERIDLGQFDTIALVDSQPETGNNSLPHESPHRHRHRPPPAAPGQRARRVVRHPAGPRRHLDDRLRVPAPSAPSRSTRRWRRRSSSRCARRRATSDASRPRPSGARISRSCRSSITTCFTA